MRPDTVRTTTGATGPANAEPPTANPQNTAPTAGASPRMRVHDGSPTLADVDASGDGSIHEVQEVHSEPELESPHKDDPDLPPTHAAGPAPGASASVPPARDWRSFPLRSLDTSDLDMMYSRYAGRQEPDIDEALAILFGEDPADRPVEPLFLCGLPPLPPELIVDLTDCGAKSLGQNSDGDVLMLHAADFDRAKFAARLLEFQARPQTDGSSSVDDDSATDATDSDSDDRDPATALTIAIHWPDADAVELLLKHGADVNQQDSFGKTPLMLAAELGQTKVARVLCHHPRIDLAAVDKDGENALKYAAEHGHAEICSLLIFFHMDPNRGAPLASAAFRGHLEVCKTLLEAGADANLDEDSRTPLMLAATTGQLACCQLLCEHGADLSLRDQHGKSVLEHVLSSKAFNFDRIALLNFLIEQGAPMSAGTVASMVQLAIKEDHLDVLQRLAELKKLDANQAPKVKQMPLVTAAALGRTAIVSLLLENGAHLFAGHAGFLALSNAVANGKVDAARLLLEAGAPVDTPISSGNFMSLLHCCFENGAATPEQRKTQLEVLELLLAYQVPLDEVDEFGNDALMLATTGGSSQAIALLMAHGLTVGQRNQGGKTALALALMRVDEILLAVQRGLLPKAEVPRRVVAMLQLMKPLPPHRRAQLAADAARSATQPLARELVLARLLLDDGQAPGSVEAAKGDLNFTALLNYLPTIANALHDDWDAQAIAERLALAGLPLDIARMMQEYLIALPVLRTPLVGPGRLSAHSNASRSLLAGLCATTEKLAAQFAHYPATLPTYQPLDIRFSPSVAGSAEGLEINLAHVMTQMANAKLKAIVDYGLTTESELTVPVFNDLASFCLGSSAAASFDVRFIPAPGEIAQRLLEAGIYLALANAIDAAWQSAWRTVSSAGATNNLLPTAPLTQAFVHELAGQVAPGTGILRLPDLPVPAAQQDALAAIYAELLHRQLNMLTQYIERETRGS